MCLLVLLRQLSRGKLVFWIIWQDKQTHCQTTSWFLCMSEQSSHLRSVHMDCYLETKTICCVQMKLDSDRRSST